MVRYSNKVYEEIIVTTISDVFYNDKLSYDAKIARTRTYTEIILRRLLNYKSQWRITIGDVEVREQLKKFGYSEPFFHEALKTICKAGNDRTHTQVLKVADKEEFERVLEALTVVYGYLFYKYFKKYKYGSNLDVVTAFSILPPMIRKVTIEHLYNDNCSDPYLIEKLCLILLKTCDSKTAKELVELHKKELERIPYFSIEDKGKLIDTLGVDMATLVIKEQEDRTMYDLLCEKIEKVSKYYKPLYTTLEEAVEYYKKHGVVMTNSQDVKEFNDLMEFVYIGRRAVKE